MNRLLLLIVISLMMIGEAYGTQCSDIFPGPQTFTTNSVDSIESGVTCNGSSCSPESFTAASPYPSYSSTGNFSSSTVVGGTTYAHNSWKTSENQTVSYSGTGTAIIYIKNDATIKKGVKINVGGNPANVLMIFNKTLKIEEGAVINAFIYVNGSETNIEKNSTINGGIAAKTKLILKENSTYTYTPADADNINAPSFCESSAPSVHHYEIEHDAEGSICTDESVTVKACTNATCSTLSADSVSLDFQIDGVSETSLIFTGSTSFNIDHTVVETVTFSLTGESITPDNTLVCDDGSGTSCDMVFTSTNCQALANWQMEQTSWNGTVGEVIDSSANGYHGTAINGAVTASVGSAISGDPGTCRYGGFDDAGGTNGDYIEVAGFPNLTTNFTMTSWVRTDDRTRAGQRIFADDESNTQGYAISLGEPGAGRIRFYSRGISPISLDTGAVINNDTWYFIAAVADITNKQRTIYTYASDGTLLDTTQASYTGTWGVDTGSASIGGETNSGETNNRFKGNIDEVRMYNRALSQTDISNILSETHACSAGVLSHLAFEQTAWSGAGVTIDDASGNENTGLSVGNAESHSAGYFCKGTMIPDNSSYSTIDAINSTLDINDAMGNDGTIMLWYRAEQDWDGSGHRILLDATSSVFGNSADKYFALSKENDGRLHFSLEDSSDNDFDLYTGSNSITAGTWVHVAVTWDMPNDDIRIFVNGSETASQTINSNGVLGDLGPVYFGDNSSTYDVVSGNSAYGRLDEIRMYDNVLSSAEITTAMGDSSSCTSCTLGSFDISQPNFGLACPSTRSTIDIQAMCADGSTQKTDYTGTIDLTSDENTNSDFYAASSGGTTISSITLDGSESGAASVYLFHKNENSDLKVTATDSDASVNSTASTGTDFRTTGFAITDPGNFVCGSASSVTVTAIGQSETGSGACSILTGFTGSKNLKAWFSVNYDPDTPGVAGAVNTPIGLNNTNVSDNSSPTATNFVLGFNSGEATVDITHLDAGEILGINFTHDDLVAGTDDVAGSVNSFVVRPNTITLSTNNASSACTSGDASCTKFVAAGSAFDLNAIAECADASKTTALSYQTPSASPVGLSLNLIAPTDTGSVNGDLGLTTLDFDDGDITNSQSVSEVGVFTITATPPAYFFQAIAASTSENIGRFYPDHFDVVVNSGGFDSSCGDFTYIGQDFTYDPLQVPSLTITAMNAATISEATQNYTVSDFMKLLAGDITRVFPLTDTQTGKDGIALMAVETTLSAGEALTAVGAGVMTYSFDAADLYRYTKNANAEIGPFDSSLSVVINDFQDVDGANASAVPDVVPTAAGSGGDSNRYGRMVMQNAYGPETDDLAMEAYTEFLAATSGQYVLNTTDNCTNLLSTIAVDPLGASGTENHTAIPVGSGTSDFSYNPLLIGGEAGFLFTAPGAGNDGDIDVSIELLTFPWLQYDWDGDGTLQNPPSTTASFGQYRGHDRIIYWREVQ